MAEHLLVEAFIMLVRRHRDIFMMIAVVGTILFCGAGLCIGWFLHHDVVLLSTGLNLDDHSDFRPERQERLHTIEHLMNPRNNLDVQTRVIARSKAFVGTYGGFSYLAPLLGVNTVAFFSDGAGFRIDHLEIAKRVFTDLHSASFLALDVRDLDVLRVGLGMSETVTSEGGRMV